MKIRILFFLLMSFLATGQTPATAAPETTTTSTIKTQVVEKVVVEKTSLGIDRVKTLAEGTLTFKHDEKPVAKEKVTLHIVKVSSPQAVTINDLITKLRAEKLRPATAWEGLSFNSAFAAGNGPVYLFGSTISVETQSTNVFGALLNDPEGKGVKFGLYQAENNTLNGEKSFLVAAVEVTPPKK